MRLDDTVVLVTGANGGIGRATCARLKAVGATVLASDIADSLPDDIADAAYLHDVSSEDDWDKVAQAIQSGYGRLDALVNAAATCEIRAIEEVTLEEWRRIQRVNVESVFIGIRAMLQLLRAAGKMRKGGSSIVNISSVAGRVGAAFNAAYCASKGAVTLFTKSAAIEFARLNYDIRVNSVHPGGVDTDMLRGIISRYVELGVSKTANSAVKSVAEAHPLGRIASPDEIAGGVVYLCSTDASFVTGSELVIDGGYTAA